MSDPENNSPQRPLPEVAKRALAEAKQRRDEKEQLANQEVAKEIDGRKGLDPARYGDWENKGIVSDF